MTNIVAILFVIVNTIFIIHIITRKTARAKLIESICFINVIYRMLAVDILMKSLIIIIIKS